MAAMMDANIGRNPQLIIFCDDASAAVIVERPVVVVAAEAEAKAA